MNASRHVNLTSGASSSHVYRGWDCWGRPSYPEAARIKERRTRAVFSSCPRVFADFLQYARALEYAAEPDYATNAFLHKCRWDVYRSLRRQNKHYNNHTSHTHAPLFTVVITVWLHLRHSSVG